MPKPGHHGRIVRDPKRCGGEPVIRGTRLTVRLIVASLAEGNPPDEVVAAFPSLCHEDVLAAVAFVSPHRDDAFSETLMGAAVRKVDEFTSARRELEAWTPVRLGLIRNERHYKAMTGFMNELLDEIGERESHPLMRLLDVVTMFVCEYEDEHEKIPFPHPE